MNENSTDLLTVCQADPPPYLTLHHEGRDYRLKWEAGKERYRLHLHHLPTRRDTYYGPDPTEALSRAAERLPKLLALAVSSPSPPGKQPKHLLLGHKGIEYKLTRHKSGEYRRKFNGRDKYFGDKPETARDDFFARIDGILASDDPRFTPGDDEGFDTQNPSFNMLLDDALAYRKSRVGISLSQARYDNLANKAKVIKECAANVLTQLANARIDRKLAITRATEIKAKHLEDLIEKLRERHGLITLDDDLQFLRFAFKRVNQRLKLSDLDLVIKETLASVPAHDPLPSYNQISGSPLLAASHVMFVPEICG